MTIPAEGDGIMAKLAHRPCDTCHGMGFLAQGADYATRSYVRCAVCDGAGQIYLDDKPPPIEPPAGYVSF